MGMQTTDKDLQDIRQQRRRQQLPSRAVIAAKSVDKEQDAEKRGREAGDGSAPPLITWRVPPHELLKKGRGDSIFL